MTLHEAAHNLDDLSGRVAISRPAFDDSDPYAVINSNLSFVNYLFHAHVTVDEIPPDALKSYYVDYYLAQVNNGGHSQFAYNSRMPKFLRQLIVQGLAEMGAERHLALFQRFEQQFDSLTPAEKEAFLASDYFGENRLRDQLNGLSDQFFEICEDEDLIDLNGRWLKSLPQLLVLPLDELEAEAQRRISLIPAADMVQRRHAALDAEPRYMQLIRTLCAQANLEFNYITAGNHAKLEGSQVIAWHFFADERHLIFADFGERAAIYDHETDQKIVEMWLGER